MNAELQTWAAGGIVLATVAIFVVRSLKGRRKKSGGGCGSSCGCGSPNASKAVREKAAKS
jgi:hypothetical protein